MLVRRVMSMDVCRCRVRLASELNLGDTTLEVTLVLHALLGKDSFLVVTAEYGERLRAASPDGHPEHQVS